LLNKGDYTIITPMRKGGRVLLISLQRRGGGALDSLGLSNGLCANSFSHHIAISDGNERAEQFSNNQYRQVIKVLTYSDLKSFIFYSLLLVRPLRIIRTLVQIRPSIVHTTHFHPWLLVVFAARPLLGYRIIYGVHEDPYRKKDKTNPAGSRFLEKIFLKRADLVAVYSEFMKNELSCRVPQEKFRTVLLGAYDEFCPNFKKRPSGPEDGLRLFFFGSIKTYKGVDVLVQAFELCQKNGIDVELTIAGAQAADVHILNEEKVRSLGIIWINKYLPDSEVCRLLGEADVVVIPYKEATQTTPGALALANGIPVIASRTGGLREQVEDGINGLLVEPGDPEDLARAIKKIAVKKELLGIFEAGVKKLYESKFAWPVIAKGLIEKIYL